MLRLTSIFPSDTVYWDVKLFKYWKISSVVLFKTFFFLFFWKSEKNIVGNQGLSFNIATGVLNQSYTTGHNTHFSRLLCRLISINNSQMNCSFVHTFLKWVVQILNWFIIIIMCFQYMKPWMTTRWGHCSQNLYDLSETQRNSTRPCVHI